MSTCCRETMFRFVDWRRQNTCRHQSIMCRSNVSINLTQVLNEKFENLDRANEGLVSILLSIASCQNDLTQAFTTLLSASNLVLFPHALQIILTTFFIDDRDVSGLPQCPHETYCEMKDSMLSSMLFRRSPFKTATSSFHVPLVPRSTKKCFNKLLTGRSRACDKRGRFVTAVLVPFPLLCSCVDNTGRLYL